MEKALLNRVAAILNLTDFDLEDQDEFVMTPDEVNERIAHELTSAKKWHLWNMRQNIRYSEEQILRIVASTNYHEYIDKEQVLLQANKSIIQKRWEIKQRKNEAEETRLAQEELQKKYTAQYVLGLMQANSLQKFKKNLLLNEQTTGLIKALCYFTSNNINFETELGFSFKKGLLIRGVTGVGKTYPFRCLEDNEFKPLLLLSMVEINQELEQEGEFILEQGNKIIYLDDVGTEETPAVNFGKKIHWFKNFIESYYLRNTVYSKLIISTNKNFKAIEEKYGFRVAGRMKEMFNIINVEGKDLREINRHD